MKKRMLMLFVSLFALTPALLGSAWGGQHTPTDGASKECELMQAKLFNPAKQVEPAKQQPNQGTQTKVF